MADIQITCPDCGTLNTVSEFVAAASIICRECKIQLQKPQSAGKTKQVPTVRHKVAQQKTTSAPEAPRIEELKKKKPALTTKHHTQQTVKTSEKVKAEPKKFRVSNAAWSWILFLVLGAITGTLRYGGVLTPNDIESVDFASPLIYIVLHILICMNIAKEAVHSGMMAFLMPPYMLYYLFVTSDNFVYRAIVAGFAVGFGQATVICFAKTIKAGLDLADAWIHNPW